MDTDINISRHMNVNMSINMNMNMDSSRIDSPSDDGDADGEGVWSPDIEECFREALVMYPPCGRRKHILQEEGGGKMYGRNELIARHIKMKTGKQRTRKQVSSHIQVLARRKAKTEAHTVGSSNGVSPSPSSIGSGGQPQSAQSIKQEEQMQQLHMQLSAAHHHHHQQQHHHQQHHHQHHHSQHHHSQHLHNHNHLQQTASPATAASALCHPAATGANGLAFYGGAASDLWLDRPIVTQKIRLVEFSAFIEHQQPVKHNPLVANTTYHPHLDTPHLNGPQHSSHLNGPTQSGASNLIATHLKQSASSSNDAEAGVIRHSYIQIDYRHQPLFGRHLPIQSRAMLESINIKQIHDKLPGCAGPDGYMQRGSPDAFYLVKFWANLGGDFDFNMEDQNSCFGFSSHFETIEPYRSLTCSIKACSYGISAAQKALPMYGAFNQGNGRYSYNLDRSPMSEFMVQFIKKLRQLTMISQMNSVLENFTVLQVIEDDTLPVPEVLLCLAYVFEVAPLEQNNGPSYHVYKLTKD